jgi:hypothetical protein
VTYVGNDVTTAFAVSFPFHAQADLVVLSTVIATGVQTIKVLNSHYTISGAVDSLGHYASGGTVTFSVAPASTERISIYRDPAKTQALDLQDASIFPAESLEAQLDYATMLVQRVADLIGRSSRQPDGDATSIGTLPSSVTRASKFLAFDSNGDPVAAEAFSSNPGSTPVSAYMATVLDDMTAPDARLTLGLPDIAAKGDLIVGSANDTLVTLAVGAVTGMVPVADPAAASGISWALPAQPNPIINGNMDVWQRGTALAGVAAGTATFLPDRFKYTGNDTTAVVALNRSVNVPSVGQAGVLFNYSFEIDVTTADAAVAATDYARIHTVIEGFNWRAFAQRTLVLSFWAFSTKTGIHSVQLSNSNGDRTYTAEYTITVTNTWEYKTVSISASPSAGTWDYATGKGLEISWWLMAGTTWQTSTLESWQDPAQPFAASSNQVNVFDNTANFFRLTGVKLEPGSVATPIAFVPFEEELTRCQRYYQKSFAYAVAPAQNTGDINGCLAWPALQAGATAQRSPVLQHFVRMRIAPAIIPYSPGAATQEAYNATRSQVLTATSLFGSGETGKFVIATGSAGTQIADLLVVHWTADAEL